MVTAVPGREDVESRCEYVDAFTVVREVGSFVSKSRGADGHGGFGTGGGVVAGVFVVTRMLAVGLDRSYICRITEYPPII